MADENGAVVILKNNTPRYLLIEFNTAQEELTASDEDVMALSKRLTEQNMEACEVLAK